MDVATSSGVAVNQGRAFCALSREQSHSSEEETEEERD